MKTKCWKCHGLGAARPARARPPTYRPLADRNVYVKPTSERTSVMVFVDNP